MLRTKSLTSKAVLFLVPVVTFAQTENSKSKLEPDLQTYKDASTIKDGPAKLAALRKFAHNFPKSTKVDDAEQDILKILLDQTPQNRQAILKQAAHVVKSAKDFRWVYADQVAQLLETKSTFNKEAERYANKSLALLSEEKFAREMRKAFVSAKLPIPPDSQIHSGLLESRTYPQLTLAETYEHEGKLQESESLLKTVLNVVPDSSRAWLAYGKVNEDLGNTQKASEMYLKALISGAVEARPKVEARYKADHNGSVAGFEDMLDEAYRRAYPNPLHPAAYSRGAKRTNRVVLAELFTGAGCPPCVAADLAFDAAALHFNRDDVAIVVYHQHIPKPDPLTNQGGIARAEFYEAKHTPTFFIDGQKIPLGGGSRFDGPERIWKSIDERITEELESPSEVPLTVQIVKNGNLLQVKTSYDKSFPPASDAHAKETKLFTVLVEDEVRYAGENGIRFHGMVARAISETPETDFNLDVIAADNRRELDAFEKHSDRFGTTTFLDKPVAMDPAHLAVVAFVQDMKTKKVLDAAYCGLQPETNH